MKEPIYAVGLGPGDPELLTLKAVRILKEVDYILVSSSNKLNTFSAMEDILTILKFIDCDKKIKVIEMPPSEKGMPHFTPERRKLFLDKVLEHYDGKRKLALITMGDISIYSSFSDAFSYFLEKGIEHIGINGFPSFIAPATLNGLTLAEFKGGVSIMGCPESAEEIDEALKHNTTVVLMKINDDGKVLRDYMNRFTQDIATCVYRAYLGGQRIYDLKKEFPEGIDFFMTVVLIRKSK